MGKCKKPQKNKSQQLESSSTNVHIVIEDLMRAYCKLFYLRFCVSSDQWKKLCKILLGVWKTFVRKNNCNYTSHKFNHKLIFISFCPFVETKTNNQIFSKLMVWHRKIFVVLVYSRKHSTSKTARIQ